MTRDLQDTRRSSPVAVGITEEGETVEFRLWDAILTPRCDLIVLKKNHPRLITDNDEAQEQIQGWLDQLRLRVPQWGTWLELNIG